MIKDNTFQKISIFCIVISFLVWVFLLFNKFYHFGYYDWDLAMVSQAMWNLSRGSQYVSLIGINFFGDHANFIALAFVPLFKLLPHAMTLVIIKLLAFHISAASFFYISKKYLSSGMSLMFLLIFLFFPPSIFANIYEFNFDCLATLFLIWMIYFYKERQFKQFLITGILTLLIKENMSLVFIMFGLFSLFDKRKDKFLYCLLPILIGSASFYLLAFKVIPYFRELEVHAFVTRYGHLGGNIQEIFHTILHDPFKVLSLMLDHRNLMFLMQLFGGLLIPVLLSPTVLFLGSPLFLQHLLSSSWQEHTIYYHYSSALVPFIFMGSLYSFHKIQNRWGKPVLKEIFKIIFFLAVIHFFFFFNDYALRLKFYSNETSENLWALSDTVPDDKSVIATFDFLAPLSTRDELYSFHKVFDADYQDSIKLKKNTLFTKNKFVVPDQVKYALINFQDRWLRSKMIEDGIGTAKYIHNFFQETKWTLVQERGQSVLFKRIKTTDVPYRKMKEVYLNFNVEGIVLNVRVFTEKHG